LRAVSEFAGAAPGLTDMTMPLRAVSEFAGSAPGLTDMTMPFRAVSEFGEGAPGLTDMTMPVRMINQPIDSTMPMPVISWRIDTTHDLARVHGDQGQGELQALIYSILAELRPREREAIELSFRHDLHGNDLALALGVSSRRAHALAARAHARLEDALVALRIALTRRHACPGLLEVLADWDGRLTEETGDLIGWHLEQCEACASYGRGVPRPATFSRLQPLAPLPPELRQRVLSHCGSAAEDAVAYRRRVARRAEPTWLARFWRPISLSWDSIHDNPGALVAAVAVLTWAAAAVAVTLLVLAGSHVAHAQVTQPSISASASSPAAIATTVAAPTTTPPAPTTAPATARPSPTVVQPVYVPPPVQPSPSPSPSRSPSPSKSPSASPSKSPSASPSASPSSSPSPTPTPTITT